MAFLSISNQSFIATFKIILWVFLALVILRIFIRYYKRRKDTSVYDSVTYEDLNLDDDPTKIRAKKTFERGGVQPILTVFEDNSENSKLTNSDKTIRLKNNLQKIKGIGPSIEKKLNAIGIFSFEQISNFNSKDIKETANLIKFSISRIERDDWVGQAYNLINKK